MSKYCLSSIGASNELGERTFAGVRAPHSRKLALWIRSARFRSTRQQPFGKVQPLLYLAHLLPQPAHLGFERVQPFEPFEPSLGLARAATPPQAAGPCPERQRKRNVNRGMQRLTLPDREAGSDQVEDAQQNGERVPNRVLERYGKLLLSSDPTSTAPRGAGTNTSARGRCRQRRM